MAELIGSEVLETIYSQLMNKDLAAVQKGEVDLAQKNAHILKEAAAKVDNVGLFPKKKVAVGFSLEGYRLDQHPLIHVDTDPDDKDAGIYLDSDGQLHLLRRLKHWSGAGDPPVDFTALGKGIPSNETYINFTKPAIRILMNIVRHTNTTLTPATT